MLGVTPNVSDEILGLGARRAVRFPTNDAVNTLAIHHDVNREATVSIVQPLEADTVLINLFAWL